MARGDHIFVRRFGYSHHGIDIGDGWVVHFSGEPWRKRDATICRASMAEFARGRQVHVCDYGSRDDGEIAVVRAESRIGESGYHLFRNNCEHFARWCVTGEAHSEQVHGGKAKAWLGATPAVARVGAFALVSTVGEVAGVSASGVMSGLGSIGGLVGGGAVAGLTLLAVGPAAAGVLGMHWLLRDGAAYTREERAARAAGRRASVVGGGAGIGAGYLALKGSGIAGLSGPGITTALAAIGHSVGGAGMTAGTAVVAAILPPAFAVLIGYAVYRLAKWWLSSEIPTFELMQPA